jgi:hypothetical protein
MPNVTIEEAREVHARMLIVDGHTDTPVEHIARERTSIGRTATRPTTWISPDARKADMTPASSSSATA